MSKTTRTEEIANKLRAAILDGTYVSGERLIELSLARAYEVSQNTVRDALQRLEHEGWVVKRARLGVHVRKFAPDDAAEVFDLLLAVEGVALRWLMRSASKPALQELLRIMAAARRQALVGQRTETIELLFTFHEAVARLCSKPLTQQMHQQLFNQARLLEAVRQARAPRNPGEIERYLALHETLMRHIETANSAAHTTLREIYNAYREGVIDIL